VYAGAVTACAVHGTNWSPVPTDPVQGRPCGLLAEGRVCGGSGVGSNHFDGTAWSPLAAGPISRDDVYSSTGPLWAVLSKGRSCGNGRCSQRDSANLIALWGEPSICSRSDSAARSSTGNATVSIPPRRCQRYADTLRSVGVGPGTSTPWACRDHPPLRRSAWRDGRTTERAARCLGTGHGRRSRSARTARSSAAAPARP